MIEQSFAGLAIEAAIAKERDEAKERHLGIDTSTPGNFYTGIEAPKPNRAQRRQLEKTFPRNVRMTVRKIRADRKSS